MECLSCTKKNRSQSNFCRFCGASLRDRGESKSPQKESREAISFRVQLPNFSLKKIPPRAAVVLVLIFFLSATIAYAAPKVSDYLEVQNAIEDATQKQIEGKYIEALGVLEDTTNKWSINSQKEKVSELRSAQERFIQYEKDVVLALNKEQEGSLKEARDILQNIGVDYPKYAELVQVKITELQTEIEAGLESDKSAAEARAEAEAAAKIRAQTDAAVASEAKARSDAAAALAAEQARQAEYQRQQEAARKVEEVKISFKSQLATGYQSYSQGVLLYSSAISYSNSGESILALSQANAALAALSGAKNSVSDLNSRFLGLPSNYYAAANDMNLAINALLNAIDLLVESEGTSLDYSSSINYQKDLAVAYAARVKNFLDSN